MERIIGIDLNLDQNQIKNAVLHTFSGSTPSSPTGGQLYYDQGSQAPYFYNGTSWISMSAVSGSSSWANIIGGTLTSQTLYVGNSTLLSYTGAGLISANQFFGSGVIPVSKGGTGRESFISGAIPFASPNTIQLNSDPTGLYYYADKRFLGIGVLSTLPKAHLHIGEQTERLPAIILPTDALATGSLTDIIGAFQFNGNKFFFIDGGGNYRQFLDIAISGNLPISLGGTNTTSFASGGITYNSGNTLNSFIGLNSVVLAGSGSTLPSTVAPVVSGYFLGNNGVTWVSIPLPASTGDVRIFPENLLQQTINIIPSAPFYIKSSGQTGGLMTISGATGPLFNIDNSGSLRLSRSIIFGFADVGPKIYSYFNPEDIAGYKGGIWFGTTNDSYIGGTIRVDASGGHGGSLLAQGLTGNAGTIDISAKNNGAAGSIDLTSLGTNAAGSITMRGDTGGDAGTLNTDGGTGGAGGDISTYGTSNSDGGAINTYGGSSANADGGNINTYGATSPGGNITSHGGSASSAGGGNLTIQGGSAPNANGGNIDTKGVSYPGGSITTSNGGGSIDTTSGFIILGRSIEGQSLLFKNPNNLSGVIQTTYLPNHNGGTLLVDEQISTVGQFKIGASGRQTILEGTVPAGSGNILLYLPNPQPSTNVGTLVLQSHLPTGLISLSNISGFNPSSGQALVWNGIVWTPATVSGGSGPGSLAFNDLTDVILTTPLSGSYVKYDGTNWVNITNILHSSLSGLLTDDHSQYVYKTPTTNSRNIIDGLDELVTLLWLQQGDEGEFPASANLFLWKDTNNIIRFNWNMDSARNHFIDINAPIQLLDNNTLRLHEISGNGSNYIGHKSASSLVMNTVYSWPVDGASGNILATNGTGTLSWISPSAGAGTVTAIGIIPPAHLGVYGSPITTSGNITLTALDQNPNLIYASPSGSPSGIPSFRVLHPNDIPSLSTSKITEGTFEGTRLTNNIRISTIGAGFDGGSSIPTTGSQMKVRIPYSGTITNYSIFTDITGSAVIDVWKTTWAGYPPTVANSICPSGKPTLTNDIKVQDSTLSGWSTGINAGDVFLFNLESVSGCREITIQLDVLRT